MRTIKSERLKKLESELQDLEQWLKLNLVPKKDIAKHKEEILAVKEKIFEEKERLQILKESGDVDEFSAPKRTPTRSSYTEMPSIPDIDMAESSAAFDHDADEENNNTESRTSFTDDNDDKEEEGSEEEEESIVEEESYFSDKNRWRRGGIVDPDADEW